MEDVILIVNFRETYNMLSSFRLKMMDKEWTKLPRFSKEYANGLELFLDFAYASGRVQGNEILCPCSKCRNLIGQQEMWSMII